MPRLLMHPPRRPRRPRQDHSRGPRWLLRWEIALVIGVGLACLRPATAQVTTVQCHAGDVDCLITAIEQANAQPGQRHEICLEAGTYTLTAAHNNTDGLNALPSVTGTLAIRGAGAEATYLQCVPYGFRLFHVAATATLRLEGLTFRDCDSVNAPGGSFYNDGGTVRLTHSVLATEAGVGRGGGFYNRAGAVTVTDSTVTGGAHSGGGFYNEAGTVTLTQTTITDNGSSGGGGFINEAGMVTLTDGAITHNGGEGGAGFWNFEGTVTLTNCTITGNRADFGGPGAFSNTAFSNDAGTVALTNCTVVDNYSEGFSHSSGGFSNGGGGTVTLRNTILAHNFNGRPPGQGIIANCRGDVISLGYNLLGDLTGCMLTPLESDVIAPSDSLEDLGLRDLRDPGTPGRAHFPLLPASPAIDAGDDAACPPTDQLGKPRIGSCDIGAVEFQEQAVSRR